MERDRRQEKMEDLCDDVRLLAERYTEIKTAVTGHCKNCSNDCYKCWLSGYADTETDTER